MLNKVNKVKSWIYPNQTRRIMDDPQKKLPALFNWNSVCEAQIKSYNSSKFTQNATLHPLVFVKNAG